MTLWARFADESHEHGLGSLTLQPSYCMSPDVELRDVVATYTYGQAFDLSFEKHEVAAPVAELIGDSRLHRYIQQGDGHCS